MTMREKQVLIYGLLESRKKTGGSGAVLKGHVTEKSQSVLV